MAAAAAAVGEKVKISQKNEIDVEFELYFNMGTHEIHSTLCVIFGGLSDWYANREKKEMCKQIYTLFTTNENQEWASESKKQFQKTDWRMQMCLEVPQFTKHDT